jgi:TonB-dependent starch-binding outer membrane protein SusC
MQLTAIFRTGSCPERSLTHKIFRVMRITAIIMLAACLQLSAHSVAQNVTLKVKDASLKEVFREIQKQTGLNILVSESILDKAGKVTLDVKDMPVDQVLNLCTKDKDLTYSIVEGTIVVKAPQEASQHLGNSTLPPIDVHGRVTDSLGNPIQGASVTVKGTRKGIQTDANGNFTLKGIPINSTIIVTIVGYEKQEIKLGERSDIVIVLKQGVTSLQDVVVSKGYYNTTERLNTGDVTTVSGADINKQPVTDPILALEGRVPGLYIQQTSGAPGAYSTVRIMGQNSISNGNDPLYIIDGVPFSSQSLSSTRMNGGAISVPQSNIFNSNGGGLSPFNGLNPADIDNIEVLKDADATAIYGSRGANGVILITTKKGKVGATRFNLNVYSGDGVVERVMPMLNTSQYLEMRREAFKNDGLDLPNITTNPSDNNYDIDGFWDTTRNTNWQKVLIGNVAHFTNAQGSVSGGTTNTQFVVGGGYSKQGTVFIGNFSDQKASAHFNLTHASADMRFRLQVGASYVYDNSNLPASDFTNSIILAPDAPELYDGNGNINWAILNGTSTFNNPEAVTLRSSKAASTNLISNMNFSYQICSGLRFKTGLGYNKEEMNQTQLFPSAADAPPNNTNESDREITFAHTSIDTWIVEPQLDYHFRMGVGKIEVLAGSTFQQNVNSSLTQYAFGYTSDALISDPLAASSVGIQGFNYALYRYNAIYGRLGYNLAEKYVFNITARRDGSSRFGPGKQFGNFGAAGVGWIFSKEKLIEDIFSALSFGKVRGSYGTSGNDQITDYQFLSTYTPNGFTYQGVGVISPTGLTNPNFAWEVVKKLEAGLDLGFVKDRIMASVTYYRNRTGNQLVGTPLPEVAGFTSVQSNLPAVVQNSGVELSLNTINIKSNSFKWTASANLTVPSNKLVAFPDFNNSAYSGLYIVGKSLFIAKLFHSTGVDPQTGLYSFSTKNTNGIPSNPADRTVIKSITQKLYGGIQNTFSYKSFQLDIFFQYVNQLGYNFKNYISSPGVYNFNQPTAVLNRWMAPGDISSTERYGTNTTVQNPWNILRSSDGVITNASFLRMKNLAFSYSVPDSWRNKMHLQNARIYLQCQNLFSITHYLGLDPETRGLVLPPLRMITAGIQADL